jgi:2-polyprenyl-3-methyl-5-hydroxy-6-metoxy-1,4-benzoquinol methylase
VSTPQPLPDHPVPPSTTGQVGWTETDFDNFSDLFERFTGMSDRLDPSFSQWLASQLPARPGHGDRALDLGCGAGRQTIQLADHYARVLGVDIADGMLAIARTARPRPNITYQHADVLTVTPQRYGTYDAVVSVHTLHHVGPPDLVLPHVRSLVAAGGIAVIADMIDPGDWTDPAFHLDRAFTHARAVYDRCGDRHAAADVIRLMLHDHWLRQAANHTPLTRDQFHHHYTTIFPGAHIVDLNPLMAAAIWRNPATAGPYYRPAAYASQAPR